MPRILILTKPKFFSLGPGIPKCSGDWWQGCERVYCHLTLYDCHVAKIDVGRWTSKSIHVKSYCECIVTTNH